MGARLLPPLLAAVAVTLIPFSPTHAWTGATRLAIAEQAASFAPADLGRLIERHRREFHRGVLAPSATPGSGGDEDGSFPDRQALLRQIDSVIESIRGHRPFRETVFRIGVIAHHLAEMNNPLRTSDADAAEVRYSADFLSYVESAQPRFAVVYYGEGRELEDEAELPRMLDRSLRRGRELYPMIGLEYRRIGSVDGVERFDDRSTAFGVGSLAFSHAVSDTAATLRHIWLRAGGVDRRQLDRLEPLQLVILSTGRSGT